MLVTDVLHAEQFEHLNQLHIYGKGIDILQSYSSTVVVIQNGHVTLGPDYNYSATTRRHVYEFLRQYYKCPFDKKCLNAELKAGTITIDETL